MRAGKIFNVNYVHFTCSSSPKSENVFSKIENENENCIFQFENTKTKQSKNKNSKSYLNKKI